MRLPQSLLILSLLQLGLSQHDQAVLETTQSTRDTSSLEGHKVFQQAIATLSSLVAADTAAYHNMVNSNRGPITASLRWLRSRSKWKKKAGNSYLRDGVGGDEGLAVKTVDLLEHAIELGDMDALFTLGDISFFPPSPRLPINATRAFNSYSRHAHLTGNATSRFILGFFHATGYGGATEIDQKRALLEWTFSAHGDSGDGNGNKHAQMALGYRYWSGVGVNEDCMSALEWYESAAEKSMAKFLTGPPSGKTLPLPPVKLSDLAGGVFGYGSSAASTGFMAARAVIKSVVSKNAGEDVPEMMEYFRYNAERGDLFYIYRLGKIHYHGSVYQAPGGIASGAEGVSLLKRDFTIAKRYFLYAARQIWIRDTPGAPLRGRKESKAKTDKEKEREKDKESYAAHSAGYLGRMHLRGEGVQQDLKKARMWFERGAENNDRESLNGLGIMWRDGLMEGAKEDHGKALEYFHAAAGLDLAEAQVNMGKHYYYRGEVALASQWFEAALRSGSPFEAYYYIGQIHAANAREQLAQAASNHLSMTQSGSCGLATSFFKVVAERGVWDQELVRDGAFYWDGAVTNAPGFMTNERRKEEALLRWLLAAEIGMEVAQNNVAFVLDQDKSAFRTKDLVRAKPAPLYTNDKVVALPMEKAALMYWTRSASQRNVDALVKVGDYYYFGIGIDTPIGNETETERMGRFEKAAGYYQSAVDTQLSALAMWNLGWMYENGVGLPQDFHLAKRYYDLALETNPEAYIPVILSLLKLHARSFWHALMGGTQKEKTLLLWSEGDDNDGWYLGKSKADMKRAAERKRKEAGEVSSSNRDDEDIVEWSRRKQEEEDEVGDFGPEDYFDGATRKRDRDGAGDEYDEDEEYLETAILVGLCILVATLMYVRARWVDRQRAEEQRQRGGANAPQPPRPGDPAFELMGLLQ